MSREGARQFADTRGETPRDEVLRRLNESVRNDFSAEQFHSPEHSANVDTESYRIGNIIRSIEPKLFDDEAELVREIVSRGHDSVIEYAGGIGGFSHGKRIRKRGFTPGDVPKEFKLPEPLPLGATAEYISQKKTDDGQLVGNELASALLMKKRMAQADPEGRVFNERVINMVFEATAVTFPSVNFEKVPIEHLEEMAKAEPRIPDYVGPEGEALNISQPYLTKDSSPVALSIALADLAYVGAVPIEESVRRGNGEYRELSELISYEIDQGVEHIRDEDKQKMTADMLKWLRDQVGFILWQKINCAHNIQEHEFKVGDEKVRDELSTWIKVSISELYSPHRFDEAISYAIDRCQKFETEEFRNDTPTGQLVAVMKEMGYKTGIRA